MDQQQTPSSLATDQLVTSWNRGRAYLGVRYPILGGAMSWLSERHLVSAISNAGGFGVLAGGNMTPARLREEIQATREMTNYPFGVNLLTIHPELPELLRVVTEEAVSHCVLAGGLPDQGSLRGLREAGIQTMVFAPSLALAKRLIQNGASALILEGHEAGGHVGPVCTNILLQEILPNIPEVPIFVAGGIANGAMVTAMIRMGAAGCQLGTRFVCTTECIAHPNFKQAFLRAQSRDAVVTTQFDPALPVIPVRALANKGTVIFNQLQMQLLQEVRAGLKERKAALLELEHFWVGSLRRAAIDGDVEHGSVMAGQSVGLIKSIQPVAQVMANLIQDIQAKIAGHTQLE